MVSSKTKSRLQSPRFITAFVRSNDSSFSPLADAVLAKGNLKAWGESQKSKADNRAEQNNISLKNSKNLDGRRGEGPNTRGLDSKSEPYLPGRLFS